MHEQSPPHEASDTAEIAAPVDVTPGPPTPMQKFTILASQLMKVSRSELAEKTSMRQTSEIQLPEPEAKATRDADQRGDPDTAAVDGTASTESAAP